MNIKDIMNPKTDLLSSTSSLQEAARKMANDGVGFLLIGDNDQLKGTLTDRDIVVRAVREDKSAQQTKVEDIITDQILYCLEDHDIEEVARNMSEQQVRRMPVVNADKRLVGVVSIGDMAQHLSPDVVGQVLRGITAERKAA